MLRRLLIAAREPSVRRQLGEAFASEEFLVRQEGESHDALDCVVQWRPECVILDVDLPRLSGPEVCRRIKAGASARVPILMVSADRSQLLINRCLRDGADDFLAKPCHATELLWRVRSLLRRYEAPAAPARVLRRGALELDPDQGLATSGGLDLGLTRKELLLLEVFMRNPGRVLSRRFLLESIWGFDSAVRTRVVDLCVFQLRRKLGPRLGPKLSTRRGFGYSLLLAETKQKTNIKKI